MGGLFGGGGARSGGTGQRASQKVVDPTPVKPSPDRKSRFDPKVALLAEDEDEEEQKRRKPKTILSADEGTLG